MKVTIIGLGYVGFPLLCVLGQNKSYDVCGFDIADWVIDSIAEGKCHVDDSLTEKLVKDPNYKVQKFSGEKTAIDGMITVSTNPEILKDTDIFIICVPTPVNEDYTPDLRPVISAAETITPYIKQDAMVILESTVNPGVCQEIVQPILEKSRLKAGEDFYFAYCPERINPGDPKWDVTNIPRNVGALSETGLQKAYEFYSSFISGEIKKTSSIKVAEASKIVENTFRDINIAFVNELAQSFDVMEIDVKEVIDAASSKPFAFIAHYPSCGVGGHCIPVDPYYLIQRADQSGFDHKFLRIARDINNSMPAYTVQLLNQVMAVVEDRVQNGSGEIHVTRQLSNSYTGAPDVNAGVEKVVTNLRIGLFGLAYKKGISDMRESPALEIEEILNNQIGKGNFEVFDPHILEKSTVQSLQEFLEKIDVLIIATDHKELTELQIQDFVDVNILGIVDGKNCLDNVVVKQSGIVYKGIGR